MQPRVSLVNPSFACFNNDLGEITMILSTHGIIEYRGLLCSGLLFVESKIMVLVVCDGNCTGFFSFFGGDCLCLISLSVRVELD